jgi:hypothetical protein
MASPSTTWASCFGCEEEFVEGQERPAPFGLVAAAADYGRYSLMGREVL